MIIKNDMSYYLTRLEGCKFNIPFTSTIQLNDHWYEWLKSDNYKPEDIDKFDQYLKEGVEGTELKEHDKIFVKTGVFSGKFDFNNRCLVHKGDNLGEHFLNIFYDALIVSTAPSREVVFREFIETDNDRPTIYNGMKLNTEFRVFLDFDHNRILGVFNYWDSKTMLRNLRGKDLETFESVYKDIEEEYDGLVPELINHIKNDCDTEKSKLEGTWSIDFLWDGNKFWMIDMALAKQSYYYDQVEEADLNRDKDDNPIIYTEEELKYFKQLSKEHDKIIKEMLSKHNDG